MSLYVLDTDCLTLLLYGHAPMSAKTAAHASSELALTIVTVEETLTRFRQWPFATIAPPRRYDFEIPAWHHRLATWRVRNSGRC
jgi:hypothetical protein